jgi:2,3-diketo-5-methylthio-1-phosphopentane phosphatase
MQPDIHRWTVICDFDGTISTVDVTDRLLEAFADPEWLEVEAEWKSGLIGSRDCLDRQLSLLRATGADIDALADIIDIDPHFQSFAKFCAGEAVPLVIVSDGLDGIIQRILDRHALGHLPVYANSMLTDASGCHHLVSPHRNAHCSSGAGTCKCEVISELTVHRPTRLLFVGDGQSDFCAASRVADVVAAKSKLLTHLTDTGRACVPYTTFADVKELLADLLVRRAAWSDTLSESSHEHN